MVVSVVPSPSRESARAPTHSTSAPAKLAEELGTITVQHKATSVQEVDSELKAFGHRPLEHMYEIGALGPNVVLNHMTALEDFEVDLIVETGTMICHNPSSALKLSKGVTQTGRFPELLRRGVTIGLGTDGSNASNHSDLFRSMSLAVLLPRDARIDPTVTVAEDGLDMAVRGGAQVSGWGDRIGALEPGRKADLIVVDTDRPDMRPGVSIVHDLVYSANGSCVRHTIIDGRIVMEDRVLLTIDEPAVMAEATSGPSPCSTASATSPAAVGRSCTEPDAPQVCRRPTGHVPLCPPTTDHRPHQVLHEGESAHRRARDRPNRKEGHP